MKTKLRIDSDMKGNNMVMELENEEKQGDIAEAKLEGNESLNAELSDVEGGYPMYHIKVDKGFYSIYELKRKYDKGDKRIILDSDFQREIVWKPIQKAELIESILMGLPLPIFYFNQDKMGRLIVVDGRQRLTTLFEFMSNRWALKGLKVLDELNGEKFSDLDPIVQSQIEDYQIQAHVIQPPTPDRIKFDIFDRVNRAGTRLNKQEIRNALYQGKSTRLLNELVALDVFREATDGAFVKNARMKDRYIVLRYLAFHLYLKEELLVNDTKYVYKNDIDELLGLTMEQINIMEDGVVEELRSLVTDSLQKTMDILGQNAFRLIRENGSRSPINMNVFEVIMHLMSKVGAEKDGIKGRLAQAVNALKEDAKFHEAIGDHRDNWQKVKARFDMVDEILEGLYD
ncbi:MAG: DUF262 domain-containing protein [Lachnospiraceae bacterium]|nr:DUF262 domain-containing protein [Lachnospiraceae bacterium]